MGLFDKLLGKKTASSGSPPLPWSPEKSDPANDPNLIKLFDEYGREMFITKQEWRDKVLRGNLEKQRNSPDDLYSMLVGALQDGFAADIIDYAEHLKRIDPIPARGATILGIVYMKVNRLDDAQRVLDEHIAKHGEEGFVLTNLAKVYSERGDHDHADAILWHALEIDPNQDNGLEWYAAIQNERRGEAGALDAFKRVAALPKSWRARLWLAREALKQNKLSEAESLYKDALTLADRPTPADLLMQMSGDLGNSGHLDEIIRLTSPYFDPSYHGLQVGNNIIKANLELGRLDEARQVLKQLYAQRRPDWKQTLNYWDTELAKAETARKAAASDRDLSVSLLSIEGPLWMRDGSPFAALLAPKSKDAIQIAVFGSTALLPHVPEKPALQLADSPGRLSRSIPLLIAETVHLTTDATGIALIPWAQGNGFALFGKPYDDNALCEMSGKGEKPDYVVGVTLDATLPLWKLNFRLVRRADRQRMAEASVDTNVEDLTTLIEEVFRELKNLLSSHACVAMKSPPDWYFVPRGHDGPDYLLRLEQQLTVACQNLDFLKGGGLYGEREIVEGILQLCVNQPTNPTVRMLYAQTLRLMKKARPEILAEYKDKTARLRDQYPIKGIESLINGATDEAFAL